MSCSTCGTHEGTTGVQVLVYTHRYRSTLQKIKINFQNLYSTPGTGSFIIQVQVGVQYGTFIHFYYLLLPGYYFLILGITFFTGLLIFTFLLHVYRYPGYPVCFVIFSLFSFII